MTHGTLLVIDDDRIMVAMLEAQLKTQGYHVVTAFSGAEGLTLARLHGPTLDAILLDRIMPEMDGLAVVRQLKQDAQLQQVPVIMQTGSDSPEQVREGIDAGVFYYLTKPLQESVLQSVVAAALRERSQRRILQQEQLREHRGFQLIDTARFRYRTLEEAESLAIFLANCFPDPQRTADNHGRGIAQARVQSFDALQYNPRGNQVLGVVYYAPEQTLALEW